MCELVLDETTIPNDTIQKEEVNRVMFFNVKNVSLYRFCELSFTKWYLCTNESDTKNVPQTYFIIDTAFHEAFSHWVYESAVFLSFFHILKMKYPNIKLLLKTKRTFKTLICRFLQIFETDIVYDDDMEQSNICIIPEPIMALNVQHNTEQKYTNILFKFIRDIEANITFNNIVLYDYCLMPRQTKENFIPNDRKYPIDNIKTFLKEHSMISSCVLETDITTDLNDQICIIQHANNIILTDGSPLLVNGLFCKGKTIIVCGTVTLDQRNSYSRVALISGYIEQNNNVLHFNNENEIIQYLENTFGK